MDNFIYRKRACPISLDGACAVEHVLRGESPDHESAIKTKRTLTSIIDLSSVANNTIPSLMN